VSGRLVEPSSQRESRIHSAAGLEVDLYKTHLSGNHGSIVRRDWRLMNFDRGNTFTNDRISDPDKRNFASPSPTLESLSKRESRIHSSAGLEVDLYKTQWVCMRKEF
jgi:hypothetical protein